MSKTVFTLPENPVAGQTFKISCEGPFIIKQPSQAVVSVRVREDGTEYYHVEQIPEKTFEIGGEQ